LFYVLEIYKLHFNSTLIEPLLVALTGALVGIIYWFIPNKILYFMEFQADDYSAKNFNKKAIIDALKKLNEISGGKLTKGNVNHPNLEKRLKNIRKHEIL